MLTEKLDGRSARISNRTGEEIPFYQKSPTPHKTHLFDTEPNDVLAITLTDAEIDIVGEYDEMNQNLFQKRYGLLYIFVFDAKL